ncbi:MAG: hypothetical protein WKG01_13285 [Kofleriaceae bacterium]
MVSRIPRSFTFSKHLPPAAIAAFRKLRADDTHPDFQPVLKAVDYPDDPVGPLAETLTPAQRAAVELITELDLYTNNNDVDHWMPRLRADRRRWLGIDPPGPLEKKYTFTLAGKKRREPGWRALKLLQEAESAEDNDGKELVAAWLKTVPVVERLAMWGVVNLAWPEVWGLDDSDFFDASDSKLVKQIGPDAANWAKTYADELLASIAAGTAQSTVPVVPFLALVRSKVPIEPRWDPLLSLEGGFAATFIKALPAERRGPAVAFALTKMGHPGWALRAAKDLLSIVPYPEIATYAIACIERSVGSPRQHLADLAKAAAKHPDVLAVIDAARKGKPAPIVLKTTAVRDVAKEGIKAKFSTSDVAQLLVAGKRYFGKKLPITKLLALDPHSEETLRHVLSLRTVADAKGKPTYDIWEYAGDSGTVFKTGTTTAVADIIQGSVECANDALREALEDVVHQRGPAKAKRPAAKTKLAAKKKSAPKKKPAGAK